MTEAVYVETIAIRVCKEISFNSFKNEITDKLISYTSGISIYMYVNKWLMLNCDCYIAIFETI